MISLETHGRCKGVRIHFGSRQIEMWACPRGTHIEPHIHKTINSRIIQLWGSALWSVGGKYRTVFGPLRKRMSNGKLAMATASIPAGVRHSAFTFSFCVFLNIERCLADPVSASQDFVPV